MYDGLPAVPKAMLVPGRNILSSISLVYVRRLECEQHMTEEAHETETGGKSLNAEVPGEGGVAALAFLGER